MDKPTYLVGFSGPPRSGKDTLGLGLATLLREKGKGYPVEVLALSLPMRLSVYALLGLDYTPEHYEANKDKEIPLGRGYATTIRQEMISLSESHVKPRLGHGWWGQALLNRRSYNSGVVIVTDMGFPAERDVFTEAFGPDNCVWVHVHREGTNFAKDSRSYVGKGTRIDNDGDVDTEVRRIYGRLVNQRGWKL